MKFKIKKQLNKGKFYVQLLTEEFLAEDEAKAAKFGMPELMIMQSSGVRGKVTISQLSANLPFGFTTSREADQYAESLKTQILELKKRWNSMEDSWSAEEIV